MVLALQEYYVDDYVDGHVRCALRSSGRMVKLLREVLVRIPDEVDPPHLVIVADSSTAFPVDFVHPHKPVGVSNLCESVFWIIVLQTGLEERSDDYIKGVIVHELGHCASGHKHGGTEHEKEADKLAIDWGFKNEIEERRRTDEARNQTQS